MKMKRPFYLFTSLILIFALLIVVTPSDKALGATTPYSVPSNVQNGWSSTPGGKDYDFTSGKKLVYDVYSSKYTSGGYKIVTKNFGKGSQPYLNFQGWAVLFGYHNEYQNNNSTYIVAKKIKGNSGINTVKIYSTLLKDIDATEDLEYNNQGSGLYEPCSDSVYNKNNTTCNMKYESVGFDAYLPLQELFPDKTEYAVWRLYLVKVVGSHIVYTPLVLPFQFSNQDYNNGKISLSSGTDANTVTMIGNNVLRRSKPRESASSVHDDLGTDAYFTTGYRYTVVDSEESQTAVWYGVKSTKDNNKTKWASTAYWDFGGDQAEVSFDPPPTHVSDEVLNYRYKNGNDYWFQPNDQGYVRLEQHDLGTGNRYQYLRLLNSEIDVRSRHDFTASSNNNYLIYTSSHIQINSATTETNNAYGQVKWGIIPKTNGDSFNVQYYYTDKAGNTVGYNDTGKNIRVDGVAPTVQFRNSADTSNFNNRDWDNTSITVRLKFSDSGSGYNQSRYAWSQSASTPSSWSAWNTSTNYVTSSISSYGQWYLHVQAKDNVGNTITTYEGPYKFNNPPIAGFYVDKPKYYIGDKIVVTSTAKDPDNDPLTYKYIVTEPNGEQKTYTTENISWTHTQVGDYTIKQIVTDKWGFSDTAQLTITVNDLTITGQVDHTPTWKDKHSKLGHSPNQFYSGEQFDLTATITDYPTTCLKVDFTGYLNDGTLYTKTINLTKQSSTKYTGMLFDPIFSKSDTSLAIDSDPTFVFTACFSNGIVRHDTVNVDIIGSVFDAFDFHRAY